jgi:hypothetical protein
LRDDELMMSEQNLTVRGVSDTARWVAYFRALESKRPDALFRDPFAERLAGEHGIQLANTLVDGNKHEWAWVAMNFGCIPLGFFFCAYFSLLLTTLSEPRFLCAWSMKHRWLARELSSEER